MRPLRAPEGDFGLYFVNALCGVSFVLALTTGHYGVAFLISAGYVFARD